MTHCPKCGHCEPEPAPPAPMGLPEGLPLLPVTWTAGLARWDIFPLEDGNPTLPSLYCTPSAGERVRGA